MARLKNGVYSRLGNRWLVVLLVTAIFFTVFIVLWATQSRSPRATRVLVPVERDAVVHLFAPENR
ncbi:MAG: hypothetical protein AB1500_04755 [Bacillota bacterium]